MSEKIFRTAIYARLSKEDGDKEESNSIVSQKEICRKYISEHEDLKLVKIYVDDGYSGVSADRPGFIEMLDAVRSKKIDAVICKDLSRFARNYIDGGKYLEKVFPSLGVRFIAVNDGYDSVTGNQSTNSIIVPFKNLMNDSYCSDISVKIRTNLNAKRHRGEFVGAFAPYGYMKDPTDKNHLVVDEYAGDIVRKIFSLFKDGYSVGRIAEWLNDNGVMSPMEYKISSGLNYYSAFRRRTEARWSYITVRRILMNEVYIGMLVQGKRGTPNYKVKVIQERDESEWVSVENNHEPLVSYEDFMSVKEMLGRDMRSASNDTEDNVFSGFLFCGDCGQPMIRNAVKSKGKKYYYYICSTNRRREGCKSHSISAGLLEKAVLGAVKTQIGEVLDISEALDYIDRLPSTDRAGFNYETQIERLEDEIDKSKRLKRRTYEDLTDGVITKKEYFEFRKQYDCFIEEKSEALARVIKERDEASLAGDTERAWVALFREYDGIEKLTHRVLMALVDKIFIYEDHTVEVEFKYGDEFCRARDVVKRHGDMSALA